MNRTLRRPMFRMGGSAEGITSGLAPRQGYATKSRVLPYDEEKGYSIKDLKDFGLVRTGGKEPTVSGKTDTATGGNTQSKWAQRMNILDAMYPRTPRRDTSFNNFLISAGIDLVSRPKGGNIFQQIATSTKEPFEKFQEAKQLEDAYSMKETSEDRALLAKMLEGMDDDKLSAMMKEVKKGVEAGYYKDEKDGIIRQLQKKEFGVMPMPGEAENERIRELELMISRDQEVPAGAIRAVAEHIYKIEPGAYSKDIQDDLNRTKTYIKPNHIVGRKKDDAGNIIEIIVDGKYTRTYTRGQIYFDPGTGELFSNQGKEGEAPRFVLVVPDK